MKTAIGITIVVIILFLFQSQIGSDVLARALITLLLWHGLWRLLDHLEMRYGVDQKPLTSAVVSIAIGTVIAFAVNKFRAPESIVYIEGRF